MKLSLFLSFFKSLVNIGGILPNAGEIAGFIVHWVIYAALVIDKLVYSLLKTSYHVFIMICGINMDTLASIVGNFTDKLEAVVIVLVVYKLATMLITYLLNPDDFIKSGTKFLKNLLIASILLISHKFIFTVFNELNVVMLGKPSKTYKYTVVNEIFGIENNDEPDPGILNRTLFGNKSNDIDPGDAISFSIAGMWMYDKGTSEEKTHQALGDVVCVSVDDDPCKYINFDNLPDYASKVAPEGEDRGSQIAHAEGEYVPILGLFIALFVTYSILGSGVQVAIRMFKLLILQMLAPVAIVNSISDENGVGKGSKFQNYIGLYFKIYIEAAVRMLTIIIVTAVIQKFLNNYGGLISDPITSAPGANSSTFGVKLLVAIMIILAGYVFAGKIPAFVDQALGTKFSEGSMKNALGSILGGAAGGLIGGAAGGGFAGAMAGLGKGVVSGVKGVKDNDGKGTKISEAFKNNKKEGKSYGKSVVDKHGTGLRGLGSYARAGLEDRIPRFVPVLGKYGTAGKTRQLDRATTSEGKLKAYDDAVQGAMKNIKMGEDGRKTVKVKDEHGVLKDVNVSDQYTSGFENIKYTGSKDSFVNQALNHDKSYINASAKYDSVRNDESKIREAEEKLRALREQKSAAELKKSTGEQRITDANNTISTANANKTVKLSEKATSQANLATAESRITSCDNDITAAKSEITRLENEKVANDMALNEAEAKLREAQVKINTARTSSERRKAQADYNAANAQIKTINNSNVVIASDIKKQQEIIETVTVEKQVAIEDKAKYELEIQNQDKIITQLDNQITEANNTIATETANVASADTYLATADQGITTAETAVQTARDDHEREVQKAREQVQIVKTEAETRLKDLYDQKRVEVHSDEHVKKTLEDYKNNAIDKKNIVYNSDGNTINVSKETERVYINKNKIQDETHTNNDINGKGSN